MTSAREIRGFYAQKLARPVIAPALVVVTDQFKRNSAKTDNPPPRPMFDPSIGTIQEKLMKTALGIAPFVRALHIDINCSDYIDSQPDNNAVFSPGFLGELKKELGSKYEDPPILDMHILGRNIFRRALQLAGVADHISFELSVAEQDLVAFKAALEMLRDRNVTSGVIGVKLTSLEQFLPFFNAVDVLGVTAGDAAGRSDGMIDIRDSMEKVRSLKREGFTGNIIFQLGVKQDTLPEIASAGADIMVCGSEIFKPFDKSIGDMVAAIARFSKLT